MKKGFVRAAQRNTVYKGQHKQQLPPTLHKREQGGNREWDWERVRKWREEKERKEKEEKESKIGKEDQQDKHDKHDNIVFHEVEEIPEEEIIEQQRLQTLTDIASEVQMSLNEIPEPSKAIITLKKSVLIPFCPPYEPELFPSEPPIPEENLLMTETSWHKEVSPSIYVHLE